MLDEVRRSHRVDRFPPALGPMTRSHKLPMTTIKVNFTCQLNVRAFIFLEYSNTPVTIVLFL